jgi:hypothetical protein
LVVPAGVLWCVGALLGGLSLLLASRRNRIGIGIGCFLYHLGAVYLSLRVTQHYHQYSLKPQMSLALALIAWSMAWFFQVFIGHWLIEGNQPNVANMDSVSLLAMCQSVLIAWST